MPLQQIVVNPVTLQQTNNKERKVKLNTTLKLFFLSEKKTLLSHLVDEIRREFLAPFAFVYLVA